MKAPVDPQTARGIIQDLLLWRVFVIQGETILAAVDMAKASRISFWDGLILSSANAAGADTVWSEDLNHGQRYGKVEVRNPFGD